VFWSPAERLSRFPLNFGAGPRDRVRRRSHGVISTHGTDSFGSDMRIFRRQNTCASAHAVRDAELVPLIAKAHEDSSVSTGRARSGPS
jgi:hypothetical protein